MAGGIEFDWDDGNTKHLADHKVTPVEFEQLLNNDPLDLDYETIDGEERYRSVGIHGWRQVLAGRVDSSRRQDPRGHRVSGQHVK